MNHLYRCKSATEVHACLALFLRYENVDKIVFCCESWNKRYITAYVHELLALTCMLYDVGLHVHWKIVQCVSLYTVHDGKMS